MKIKFDIDTNFHDFFSSAVDYWKIACNDNNKLAYKKAIIFLATSIELGLLIIINKQTEESIYTKSGKTISIGAAYKMLRNYSYLYEDINKRFFSTEKKGTCIGIIRSLRNQLLHGGRMKSRDQVNEDIAHAILVFHYLMLPIENLIINSESKKWLIEKIQNTKNWNKISKIISEALDNEVCETGKPQDRSGHYSIYPEQCLYCDSENTIILQYDSQHYQGVCFICLQPFKVRACHYCGTEILEEDIIEINDAHEPDNVMCSNCYDHKFKI